mmetsp:Transcript_17684/g.36357  ORF Transcript_17684/g.36357 Transcript_17684/m.36357 type:complete len:337 (+) Transcript_17684:1013-2023(+)
MRKDGTVPRLVDLFCHWQILGGSDEFFYAHLVVKTHEQQRVLLLGPVVHAVLQDDKIVSPQAGMGFVHQLQNVGVDRGLGHPVNRNVALAVLDVFQILSLQVLRVDDRAIDVQGLVDGALVKVVLVETLQEFPRFLQFRLRGVRDQGQDVVVQPQQELALEVGPADRKGLAPVGLQPEEGIGETQNIAQHALDGRRGFVLVDDLVQVQAVLEEVHHRGNVLVGVTDHVVHLRLVLSLANVALVGLATFSHGDAGVRDHLDVDPSFSDGPGVVSGKVIDLVHVEAVVPVAHDVVEPLELSVLPANEVAVAFQGAAVNAFLFPKQNSNRDSRTSKQYI